MLPLFLFIFTLIEQAYNIYVYYSSSTTFFSTLLPLSRGPPLGCRVLSHEILHPPSPVKNPRKLKEKQDTNYPRSEEVTTAIEQNPGKEPPGIVFFCSRSTLIQ
jgi:hypothetical protein